MRAIVAIVAMQLAASCAVSCVPGLQVQSRPAVCRATPVALCAPKETTAWIKISSDLETAARLASSLLANTTKTSSVSANDAIDGLRDASIQRLEAALGASVGPSASSLQKLTDSLVENLSEGARVLTTKVAQLESQLEAARTRAGRAERSEAASAVALEETRALLARAESELEAGRLEAAQAVSALDDALEFTQDDLTKTKEALRVAATEIKAAKATQEKLAATLESATAARELAENRAEDAVTQAADASAKAETASAEGVAASHASRAANLRADRLEAAAARAEEERDTAVSREEAARMELDVEKSLRKRDRVRRYVSRKVWQTFGSFERKVLK